MLCFNVVCHFITGASASVCCRGDQNHLAKLDSTLLQTSPVDIIFGADVLYNVWAYDQLRSTIDHFVYVNRTSNARCNLCCVDRTIFECSQASKQAGRTLTVILAYQVRQQALEDAFLAGLAQSCVLLEVCAHPCSIRRTGRCC